VAKRKSIALSNEVEDCLKEIFLREPPNLLTEFDWSAFLEYVFQKPIGPVNPYPIIKASFDRSKGFANLLESKDRKKNETF
jgi:hypothetical protein